MTRKPSDVLIAARARKLALGDRGYFGWDCLGEHIHDKAVHAYFSNALDFEVLTLDPNKWRTPHAAGLEAFDLAISMAMSDEAAQ